MLRSAIDNMQYDEILTKLMSLANPRAVKGMARFGIHAKNAYGIAAPTLQKIAREIGTDHALAQRLWASGNLDARYIAAMIDDPARVTKAQMERWASDFDSWSVCDSSCGYLFDKTPFAYRKAIEWSKREEEYVKRAGFALMAYLAVHDKAAPDAKFIKFLPMIKRGATDGRNFVRKAVNWALRQIGKRNLTLNKVAIKTAREIQKIDSKASRWIAADALRELTGRVVQKRLRR